MIDKTMMRTMERQLAATERMAKIAESSAEQMERVASALEVIAAQLAPAPSTPLLTPKPRRRNRHETAPPEATTR